MESKVEMDILEYLAEIPFGALVHLLHKEHDDAILFDRVVFDPPICVKDGDTIEITLTLGGDVEENSHA